MTVSLGINSYSNVAPVTARETQEASTTQATAGREMVQIAKADGLRGALGLYEVSTHGGTQFMSKEELENIPHLAAFVQSAAAASAQTSSSVIKQQADTAGSVIVKGFG